MTIEIRRARRGDEAELAAMIYELAAFENAADECVVTESSLRDALFVDQPTVYAHVAEVNGEPAAAALWFRNFSTWDGVAGIYLEDLFVRPQARGHGVGRKVLEWLAAEVLRRNCGRLEWAVLDWNEPSIQFYRNLGAVHMKQWQIFRLTGPALTQLASAPGALT
jgi:GNAT superfamily N-acetyltransferase